MKRVTGLFPRITERDNLRLAFYRALRGKRDRADVREFAWGLEANLREMAIQLRSGALAVGRCLQFTIHDPKRRTTTGRLRARREPHFSLSVLPWSTARRSHK